MIDWTRTSERNLLYVMDETDDAEIKALAATELNQRLQRYFAAKVLGVKSWHDLKQEQDDIINETIARLLQYHRYFQGNSWQFRKYIRNTLLNVCYGAIRESLAVADSLDAPIRGGFDDTEGGATLGDLLHVPATMKTHFQVSVDWIRANESFSPLLPESATLRREEAALIEAAAASLDERCRHLLQLVEVEQDGQQAIAEAMNMSYRHVRVSLNRCRQRLLRSIVQLLAERHERIAPVQLEEVIAQLPHPQNILIQTWWQGENRWRSIAEEVGLDLPQAEIKTLFASGLYLLFQVLAELTPKEQQG